jgi:hypothetical protein
MKTHLYLVLLAVSSVGWAQELPDAGLPDASVGEGGADRGSEENDPNGGPCLDAKSCGQGFGCVEGRCVPQKPITVGCSTVGLSMLPWGLLLLAWRRTAQGPSARDPR